MSETDKPPTLILRAVRRNSDGSEQIDEREVRCESAEELYALLCRTPTVDIAPPEFDGSKLEETVGALRSWLTSLKLVLEQAETEDGTRRWTFGWQPATAVESATAGSPSGDPPAVQRVELGADEAAGVSGHLEAAIHTGPAGDRLIARRAGQNVQMLNTGLCTWQTNNLICQIQMHVNFVIDESAK